MNERIEKLAAKHALYVDGGAGKTNYTFTKESLKEFTELIVKECEVALKPPIQVRDVISRGQAYNLIKQHFGVEE
jgi:hypothetical protein